MTLTSDAPVNAQQLKTAQAAIAAAKDTLLKNLKAQALSKHLHHATIKQALDMADAMIAKNKLPAAMAVGITSENALMGLLQKNRILGSVLELAMRKESALEERKARDLKDQQKKNNHAKKAEDPRSKPHDYEAPEAEFDAPKNDFDAPEFDGVDEPTAEFDSDEPGNALDLNDLENAALDIEELDGEDIEEVQAELMEDIKKLPSVGDQSAMMFVVSQLKPTNEAFRTAGAAHLMQSVKNGLLTAEDQVLAFAGAEALRDPSKSMFAAAAPNALSGATADNVSVTGALNTVAEKNENDLVEMAVEQANKPHAPFTLIADAPPLDEAGGRVAGDLQGYTPYTLETSKGLFVDNIGTLTEKAAAPEPVEQEVAYEAPAKKAKSPFDMPEFKPSQSFFDAISKTS